MILASFNGFWDIIRIPFGWLLALLYDLTNNYGVALIIFAVALKVIMLPLTAKSKKSMMKMSRLTPKVQALQRKYANDQQKLNEETQKLYKDEGVSMGGGCLWSFIPLLILIPLYNVVREPLVYLLGETPEVAAQIVELIKTELPAAFGKNNFYDQLVSAPLIPQFAEQLKNVVANPDTLLGMEFNFLNINLGSQPVFNVFKWEAFSWAYIGSFLIPLLSAGSQVLSMMVGQKLNNSVVTNEKGLEDAEAAKNSQTAQSNKMMMWMMPLMSLWIGFTVPCALSLYWFVQGVVSLVMDVFLTKHYRKVYDAEDEIRRQRAQEAEALEAEKERIRAERRAANPEGITQNTSKKKLQQKMQREEEAAKREAAKEYAMKKGIYEEDEEEQAETLSGISDRPNAKGRAYDPNRYASNNTEE